MKIRQWVHAGAISAAAICFALSAQAGPTFDKVKQAGQVVCGVNTGLAGFAQPDNQGHYTGLDVDICRALAAALFGDATKVKYVPLTAQQRFTALQSGEVDVLSRNTTWTLQRDTDLGLNFTAVVYYDGQGFMVAKKLGGQKRQGTKWRHDLRAARDHDGAQPRRLLSRQQDRIQTGRDREARRSRERVLFRTLRRLHH